MLTSLPPKLDRRVRTSVLTNALTQVAHWVDTSAEALVLEGGTGSGKTIAAGWGFAFFAHRPQYSPSGMRRGPVWCDAPTIASWQPWDARWSEFDGASLVVLDDVGTETDAGRMAAVLERSFNVASGRLLITTNLAPDTFADRYGDRVFSRISGARQWVRVADEDMRIAPPSGEPYRQATDASPREIAERKARAQAELAEAEEMERTAAERAACAEGALREIEQLVGAKRLHIAPRNGDDDESRRALLRAQVEQRSKTGSEET